jgi:uncharacterized membrane protein
LENLLLSVIQVLFLLLFPFVLVKISEAGKKAGIISPILLCYLVGIILGNIKVVPLDRELSMTIAEAAVPVAIPLIMFSTDFKRWMGLARKTIISFFLVIISVVISSVTAYYLFSGYVENADTISGMLTGVYTGGTPNLIAVGTGLHIPESTLILINTSDSILGGTYFLLLISAGKWLFGKILPKFDKSQDEEQCEHNGIDTKPDKNIILLLLLSVVFVGISILTSMLISAGSIEVSIVMLMVTTLGILASFNKKIRNTKGTYKTGQYIIYIFSLAIGTNVNFNEILNANSALFAYTAYVMFGAIIIHIILAAVFRIDRDTAIITSTAGIYGPAFIIPAANAIKNREVILSGLLTGLVGYAVGNYLGYLIAYIL